ncbi:alpha/beta hydrolase [Saccharothrix violaceirubra]|uniref:Pimeloyl-ACP methyl ester carboxylesterase n=1 Tax=Saccharothrix violaceirubra TaxID=413306 RepID=A0A7W7T4N2_9PSEU|nr:alpha/beta hydrolase [Saccharothrix violaceirubra]MBB4966524.1 pimeloyl-ACP methyl ester carboxylesterase [Saccharothrix violaceirubra]
MPQHHTAAVNGIDVHYVEEGEGPLVLLLHGFPESWYSWRHQFGPLAAAGYRVVAPDQRGYGGTDRPAAVDAYTMPHLVGDVVGLIGALGERQAVVVGHDWGAPVAWHTALFRPDLVRGVVGLSVAPSHHMPVPPLSLMRQRFGDDFYQLYFQEPGVADAELAADPRATFRKVLVGGSATGTLTGRTAGTGFIGDLPEPATLPSWFTEADVEEYATQYGAAGFTGGLNWYRNIDRNWELTAPWRTARITPPAALIAGDHDLVRTFYPPGFLDQLAAIVPDLRAVVDVPDCGHWTQQEQPERVNAALLEFLAGLD